MNNHTEFENKEIRKLKELILNTPVHVDLTDRIMEHYEKNHIKTIPTTKPQKTLRRSMLATVAIIFIFTIITGTGFISPTMAAVITQIPGMNSIFQVAGDLGLKIADEKGLYTQSTASDTHHGLTVQSTAVMFDGTRVSIGIESKELDKAFDGNLSVAMSDLKLSINGESINSYSALGDNSIGQFTHPGSDKNKMILEFSDLKDQGGRAFPQNFELSLDFTIPGIQEPFKLNIPVEMNTKNNLVLTPTINRKHENINFKIDKIEFTPITTKITTQIVLPENMKISQIKDSNSISYNLFDEDGNQINLISGNGWYPRTGNALITDTRFEPFESIPKSITLKPYTHVYKADSPNEFQLDSNGDLKVNYIPELEITLPIISN